MLSLTLPESAKVKLRIPGFVAAQFFKLSDTQYAGTQPQRYLLIWEIEFTKSASAKNMGRNGP